MKKGYLSVPPYSVEKPQFINEKQVYQHGYSDSSPLIEDKVGYANQQSSQRQRKRSWLQQKWIHLSYYLLFLSPRQKEKSTRKTLMLRSRTRGLKLLFTLLFCSLSVYFIHRFIHNHIHYALPTEVALEYMKSVPSAAHIKNHYSLQPSTITGSDQDKVWAEKTRTAWINYGLPSVSIATYWPLLTIPQYQSLTLVDGTKLAPISQAYAGTGNVTGPIVYVNYGRLSDFQFLQTRGTLFNGTIALMRQERDTIKPGTQIKLAQEFGCLGAILYQDPADNPWSSDIRKTASVQFSVGDPLTPGNAATEHAVREEQAHTLPKIPSVAVAWQDAFSLLNITQGHGVEMDNSGSICNLTYFSGPSQAHVQLVNRHAYEIKPVWNVMGKIKGSVEPHRAIIVGAHRDGVSSSAAAILMELVRTLGILLEHGWKPRRTIVVASWDASEYGAVGSTEWAEDHQAWLTEEAVAYLHLDAIISGTQLNVQASPLLEQLFKEIMASQLDYKMVLPDADTDASAFFSHLGISTLSMSLENGDNSSTTAATTVADAGFHLEQTLTQVWGQLIVHLSSASLLPLHPHDTITAISHFLDECGNLTYTTAVIQSLQSISARIETHTANLRHQLVVKKHVSRKLLKQVARANERAMAFERAFLQQKQYGWYRHVVYAPDVHTGVSRMFPALVDAVQSGNMSFVEEADLYIANMLMEAGKALWDDDDDDDDDSFVDEDDEEENN